METKLKDKLLKLYALSKRGVGGEKVNAENFLTKLLQKHDLTIEDIDQEIPKSRYYRYTNKLNKKITYQVINKVTNSDEICNIRGFNEVLAKVTDYQHVQILELIDFHLSNFNKERNLFLKDFTSAYVQKHELFRAPTDNDFKGISELTDEEEQSFLRMISIKDNLGDKSYTKKLE